MSENQRNIKEDGCERNCFCILKILLILLFLAVGVCAGYFLHKISTLQTDWAYSDSLEISKGVENPLTCKDGCKDGCTQKVVKGDSNIFQKFHNIRKGKEYFYIPAFVCLLIFGGFVLFMMDKVWVQAAKINSITKRYKAIVDGFSPYDVSVNNSTATAEGKNNNSDKPMDDKKFILTLYRDYISELSEI